jgi:hypothetical protein
MPAGPSSAMGSSAQQQGWWSHTSSRTPRSTRHPQSAHRNSISAAYPGPPSPLRGLGVPGFLRRAHAEVVRPAWRYPTEKRRSRAFAPTIRLTPALEPRHPLRLCDPSEKRRSDVQPDHPEEHLAHNASLMRYRTSAAAVIMRACLPLARSARMSRSSAGSEGRPMNEHGSVRCPTGSAFSSRCGESELGCRSTAGRPRGSRRRLPMMAPLSRSRSPGRIAKPAGKHRPAAVGRTRGGDPVRGGTQSLRPAHGAL